jgi:hypothetical protein
VIGANIKIKSAAAFLSQTILYSLYEPKTQHRIIMDVVYAST